MTRIDVWLWSVRVYKSRSLATAAVKGGHIRLNGDPVKPSHAVKPGDTVTVHTPGWDRVLQVINPITKRVGAKLAVEAYEDLSAPDPPTSLLPSPAATVGLDDPPRRIVARSIGSEAGTLAIEDSSPGPTHHGSRPNWRHASNPCTLLCGGFA